MPARSGNGPPTVRQTAASADAGPPDAYMSVEAGPSTLSPEPRLPHARSKERAVAAATAAFALLGAMVLASVAVGPDGVDVGPRQALASIMSRVPFLGDLPLGVVSPEADAIVWEVRLPRALCAALVGMLLAYAGVALQGLLMNPLADPYTVGVSAGAAVGAAVAEVVGVAGLFMGLAGVGAAFVAALGAVSLVYALARVGGRVSVQTFLLAGVVVGTMLWSLIPLIMVLAHRAEDLQRIFFYLIGSVQGADWTRAWLLAPFAVAVAVFMRAGARDLNLMTFGEETAAHLGVPVEAVKRRVLVVGSLATAAAVSVGGIIGFVGLVVPHAARAIVGPDHRALMPLAAAFGGLLLVTADIIVRVLLNDMPVGVITSVVGAPVFCWLLRRRRAVAW